MKQVLKFTATILLTGVLFHISCKKEYSCENCGSNPSTGSTNKFPIANAGPDQVILAPTDSALLDGSASYDADGTISNFRWTKISGPASFSITNEIIAKTVIKNLALGTYQFELSVKDNGGLSAKDTVQITVNDPAQPNRPPVANAGNDTTITLPANTVTLDGSGSTDPDNNISLYIWARISGPSALSISNPNAVQTQVTNFVQGTNQFELRVIDAGGLLSRDTMQVTVNPGPPPPSTCTPLNRPNINTQLMPLGTLSEARSRISVASAGNKILFAGGQTSAGTPSSTVDIYDIVTQTWSTAQLSLPRYRMAAISAGNKIYFAGGHSTNVDTPSSRVDIYDVASNSWSTTELSEPRSGISAETIGNKIMFAGGMKLYTCSYCFSDRVDIYDISTNSWSTATLSVAREGLSATSAGNKIYFAGGGDWNNGSGVYDQIDIYDNAANTWSTSTLIEPKSHHGAIAVGNYIYWAGGEITNNFNDYETTCTVERRDLLSGTSAVLHLFQPSYANSNGQPRIETLLKNGSIVFYTGSSLFDIYNPVSDLWSIGIMNRGFDFAGVISVNNTIYIAGGGFFPYTPPSNQVWKLEF